ncbi:hypothetical protein LXL04_005044 [Taraxacum kok-saghyz]
MRDISLETLMEKMVINCYTRREHLHIHPRQNSINSKRESSDDLDSNTDSEQEIQTTVKRKSKRKRGLTRLPKVRTEHTNSGGRKKHVKFDEIGRFTGKYRAQFPSFWGDLVREKVGLSVHNWRNVTKEVRDKLWEEIMRYYEIEDTRRKYVMTRLGALLRNFRRKLYAKYIEPNLKNPSKLAVIPKRYRTIIINQEHWNAFVTYPIKNFKAGEIVDDGVQVIAEKLVSSLLYHFEYQFSCISSDLSLLFDQLCVHQEQEQKIIDGELSVDPGEDAMTVVFGKKNRSYLKGVGTGVTSTRYFHNKDQQLEALSTKLTEQAKTLTQVLALLDSQGLKLPDLPSSLGQFWDKRNQSDILLVKGQFGPFWDYTVNRQILYVEPLWWIWQQGHNGKYKIGFSSTLICLANSEKEKKVVESNTATTIPETPSDFPKAVTIEKPTTITDVPRTGTTDSQIVPKSIKCTLAYPDQRNIVALGEIHLSSERQVIHGVPLQDDSYKVYIEELRKPNSFLSFETGEYKTVGEAFKSFAGQNTLSNVIQRYVSSVNYYNFLPS